MDGVKTLRLHYHHALLSVYCTLRTSSMSSSWSSSAWCCCSTCIIVEVKCDCGVRIDEDREREREESTREGLVDNNNNTNSVMAECVSLDNKTESSRRMVLARRQVCCVPMQRIFLRRPSFGGLGERERVTSPDLVVGHLSKLPPTRDHHDSLDFISLPRARRHVLPASLQIFQ
jgi:hypothetical protein